MIRIKALFLLFFMAVSAFAGQVTTRVTGTVNWGTASTWIQLRTGTATFVNGSRTVTGSGTSFTGELQAGDLLMLAASPGTVRGTVQSISNDTVLTLVANAGSNVSGQFGRQRVPGSTDDVTIGNVLLNANVTVTLNVASASVNSLTFVANGRTNTLRHTGTNALAVTGHAVIHQPTANSRTNDWRIDAGSGSAGGNLTIGGTNTTTSRRSTVTITTGSLAVAGNVVYNSAATQSVTAQIVMTGASPVLTIGGNLTLTYGTGTLSPGSSGTVRFNGTGTQSFQTGSSIVYQNIAVDKSSGLVSPSASTAVGGNLTVVSGTLDLQDRTLNRSTPGGSLSVGAGAALSIGGTNGMPSNYSSRTFNPASTVNYYGSGQTVSRETYGNLILSGSDIKVLPADTLIVEGDFTHQDPSSSAAGSVVLVRGDWTAGAGFSPGSGRVIFDGTAPQSISGAGFHSLTIDNAAGVSLNSPLFVADTVEIADGMLATGIHTLTLGPSGTLVETEEEVVDGNLLTSRDVSQTSGTERFGNIGASIMLNGVAPGLTTVSRVTGTPSTGNGNSSISRRFGISPAVNAGLGAGLEFRYSAGDLAGHLPEDLRLYKSTDGGATWTDRGGIVDTAQRLLAIAGLDGFSSWTASDTANSLGGGPVPVLASADPDSKRVHEGAFTMTVSGSDFTGSSVVRIDGVDLPTTYLGETSLSAGVADSQISSAGVVPVTVFTPGGGSSSAVDMTVLKGQTELAVTAGPDTIIFGDTAAFAFSTTSLLPASGTPGGTIVISESGNPLDSAALDQAGGTTIDLTFLGAGDHVIAVAYAGSADYHPSADTIFLHVLKSPVTVTVSTSPDPTVHAEAVAIEATVSGPATPAGTVTFYDGGAAISGPVALDDSGRASISTSALTVGAHSISAGYSGGAEFHPGADTVLHTVVCPDLVILPATLEAGRVDSVYETQFMTLPAGVHVYGISAGSLPSGLSLQSSGLLAGVPSEGGTFGFSIVSLDTTGCADTVAYVLMVGIAPASAGISSGSNPSVEGDTVEFSVTLIPAAAAGTAEFFSGGASLGSAPVVSGTAAFSVWTLGPGIHDIHAVYSGDGNYGQAASDTVVQTVLTAQLPIVSSAGQNGSVEPAGTVMVDRGSDIDFVIAPGPGHHTDSVIVDGVNLGVVPDYQFQNVQDPHSISGWFSINVYQISSAAWPGGSISPPGAVSVNHGGSQHYSIAPAPGYHIDSVVVDGMNIGAATEYDFANVAAGHSISAWFSINVYSIAASSSAGGSIDPSGVVPVVHGASRSFTVTAAPGHHIDSVLVDGANQGPVGSHDFTNVTAGHAIEARFSINTYPIMAAAGAGGSIAPSGEMFVSHGGSQAFAVSPAPGFAIDSVYIDGVHVGAAESVTIDGVTSAHTVLATFKQVEFAYAVAADWNLVSVPIDVADNSMASLYPVTNAPVYAYANGYRTADTAIAGVGYWVKFPQAGLNLLSGEAVESSVFPVNERWNIIGSISGPVSVDDIVENPPGTVVTDYFGYDDGYYIADSIIPGRAYWVKASTGGTLGLNAGGEPAGLNAAGIAAPIRRDGRIELNELVISPVQAGPVPARGTRLYFGEIPATKLGSFDLPPVPPAGAFDARFASHRSGAQIGAGEEAPLLIQNVSGRCTVTWSLREPGAGPVDLVGRIGDREISRIRLEGSGSAPMETAGGLRYFIASVSVPENYALDQNYPNPFNPVTIIGFDLPVPGEVSLVVYDLTGRVVARPIEGRIHPAGKHNAQFDASDMASGIYYYRLTARGFSATRKMVLLK